MPLSALETGLVDLILTPAQMAEALTTYAASPGAGRQYADGKRPPARPMAAIFRLLWEHHGIDFTHYKAATIMRRIERRVALSAYDSIEPYVQHLAEDAAALNQLYKDLLIGVTRFFRDAEAFDYLERDIVPLLMQDAARAQELRVWVAGCATGEEAYSLAMLLYESLQQRSATISAQIFATDVHQASLDTASEGFYPREAVEGIAPERLARFFIEEVDGYRVAPILRQMIVFARHDLTQDAPFTKLDFITCRNVLIYFQPDLQQQILRRLHYGLRLGGMLFLGLSESVGRQSEVLAEVDRHWRVYRKDQPSGFLGESMPSSLAPQPMAAARIGDRSHAASPRRAPARQQLYNVLLEGPSFQPAFSLMRRANGNISLATSRRFYRRFGDRAIAISWNSPIPISPARCKWRCCEPLASCRRSPMNACRSAPVRQRRESRCASFPLLKRGIDRRPSLSHSSLMPLRLMTMMNFRYLPMKSTIIVYIW